MTAETTKKHAWRNPCVFLEATTRLELVVEILQTSALPLGYVADWSGQRGSNSLPPPWQGGALPDELCPQIVLPKPEFRENGWCLRPESNQRHRDFQSLALPTELQRRMATRMGLEPTTSGVTGRRSNQLNYRARLVAEWKVVGTTGLEPVTSRV